MARVKPGEIQIRSAAVSVPGFDNVLCFWKMLSLGEDGGRVRGLSLLFSTISCKA